MNLCLLLVSGLHAFVFGCLIYSFFHDWLFVYHTILVVVAWCAGVAARSCGSSEGPVPGKENQ